MSVRGKLLKRSALLKAKDGDVLVVRYSGKATAKDAHAFARAVSDAVRELKMPVPKLRVVVAPAGVEWSIEEAPA